PGTRALDPCRGKLRPERVSAWRERASHRPAHVRRARHALERYRSRSDCCGAEQDDEVRKPILVSTRARPWTRDGFKASWAKELNKPEMAEIRRRRFVFHGLGKSAVVFLREAGCSDAETASITGQSRRIVEHYAKQVNQRRLAAPAILKWEAADAARASDQKKREKRSLFVQPAPEIVQQAREVKFKY